jgi:transposase
MLVGTKPSPVTDREPSQSALTDVEWGAVEPLIPPPAHGGRRRETDMREVVNAIQYVLATGCGWRGLPRAFPNRSTVRHYYDAWRTVGLWERIVNAIRAAAADAAKSPARPGEFETAGSASQADWRRRYNSCGRRPGRGAADDRPPG